MEICLSPPVPPPPSHRLPKSGGQTSPLPSTDQTRPSTSLQACQAVLVCVSAWSLTPSSPLPGRRRASRRRRPLRRTEPLPVLSRIAESQSPDCAESHLHLQSPIFISISISNLQSTKQSTKQSIKQSIETATNKESIDRKGKEEMAFLGSPPQSYWPSPFVADPAFDPELTDPSAGLHDAQQPPLPHGVHPSPDNAAHHHHHILDPALSDDMPPPQGQHPIIFHQTSPHSYAPPPPFEQGLPPPDQIYSPTRIRAPSSKDLQTHNNGEVVMDDGHGAAYIAPAQHPFLGNGMHHPDMHQPLGQPPQIKFRATTNNSAGSGSHGRRPKMTKEEQMARRRLRTDTDEYRTQERERMRRRRAREKEERERMRREQEEQLRAEGKESWIAPATAPTTTTTTTTTITTSAPASIAAVVASTPAAPKRKTVKMVKKKASVAAPAAVDEGLGAVEEDTARESKRQAKVDSRAAAATEEPAAESMDVEDAAETLKDEVENPAAQSEGPEEQSADSEKAAVQPEESAEKSPDGPEGEAGSEDRDESPEDDAAGKKDGARASTRRAAVGKSNASTPRPTRSAAKAAPAKPAAPARPSRAARSAPEPDKVVQEITTTRSGRTTRSALSSKPAVKDEQAESPVQAGAAASAGAAAANAAAPTPLKITTRKQTVTTVASPSSPAVSKTRVSLKSLSTAATAPSAPTDAKSPSSARTEPKSGQAMAPVVMLFGYPAGANPPCDVGSVSVTVESTRTGKICMMTADDMRRPATPAADEGAESTDRMDVDENKDKDKDANEEGEASEKPAGSQRGSSTPDANASANGRFSWDLVVQVLKADVGFDPATDELVGFHHKDPLLLSCDRHLNTAMTMAAKEGVRMPKWYVYEKQQQPQAPQ
ncbi:hypothetical protein Dda_5805 [Drechslerella dactyloides]|uniref:Uncharacterized protein n=1 Tax=Drechslerella dactyloides TaxID=74499 RepID=A0AAD6NHW8_DREDA|nr:hypothetical protein Dda_5805 [Drechslerella dactyloides]